MQLITNLTLVLVVLGMFIPQQVKAQPEDPVRRRTGNVVIVGTPCYRVTEEEMVRVCQNWLAYVVYYEEDDWAGDPNPQIVDTNEIVHNDTILARCFSISPSGHVVVPGMKELAPIKAYSEECGLDVDGQVGYPRLLRDALVRWARVSGVFGVSAEVSEENAWETRVPGGQREQGGRETRAEADEWPTFLLGREEFDSLLHIDALIPLDTVGPLCSTRWHQYSPYNNSCPHHWPVGCVAIAAAQVMRYHAWPPMGDGSHCYTNWNGEEYCADFSDPYDWANMPDSCDEGCSPAEESALAELCNEVGVAFEMGYTIGGSSARTYDACTVFPTYFRYDDSIHREDRIDYETCYDWFELIQREINLGRPMMYSIEYDTTDTTFMRHSLVCDGWSDSQNRYMYHINYGWGDDKTAWYAIDTIRHAELPDSEYVIRNIIPLGLSGSVSGTIGPNTYHISGDIWVDPDSTLVLMSGTTFLFDGPYSFNIYGTLLAGGQDGDSIIFTAGTSSWCGLRFSGSGSSACSLAYCVVEEATRALDNFGGVYCFESSPDFTHCVIRRNGACCPGFDAKGGGVACRYSSPSFTNCTISDNDLLTTVPFTCLGGGVYCEQASPIFSSCLINYNEAYGDGGGVYCENSSFPEFTNCIISHNSAELGGGVYCSADSWPEFAFCTFSDNTATSHGGGAYCCSCSTIINSAIIAFSEGEGVYFAGDCSDCNIKYCDFYGNTGGPFGGNSPPYLGQLDTTNANGDSCDVYSNILVDPMFVDRVQDGFQLDPHSRCIGAADSTAPPPEDYDGNPRPNPTESIPDIGAYENELGVPRERLCGALSGILGPGPFRVGCMIYIAYDSTLELRPGTTFLFEGPYAFNINGTLLAEGTPDSLIVFTIDPSWTDRRRGLRFLGLGSTESRLAYCRIEKGQVFAAELDSVEFETGRAMSWIYVPGGGGVFCYNSSPVFVHCEIISNVATGVWPAFGRGGGGLFRRSSATFDSCTFLGNSGYFGGGVCCQEYDSTRFEYCIFQGNSADSLGGGAACFNSPTSPSFIRCTLDGNSATDCGGGAYVTGGSSPTFADCHIRENWANVGGGLYCDDSGSPASLTGCVMSGNSANALGGGAYGEGDFRNCIVTDNSTNGQGGGVFCHYVPSFTNCILADNSATGNGGGVACDMGSGATFEYCTLSGNSTSGDGGGVYCVLSSTDFNSTIIAFSEGAGVHFDYDYSSTLEYCDVFGNDTPFAGDVPEGLGELVTQNANGDPCDIFYNILFDPAFFDRALPDYHLYDTSHCIGAANRLNRPPQDMDGSPRPNPPGSNPDIGAYEHWWGPTNPRLVISLDGNHNAVLSWPGTPTRVTYIVYGDTVPYGTPEWQMAVVTDTTWTDEETSQRPDRFFYYVEGWEGPPNWVGFVEIACERNGYTPFGLPLTFWSLANGVPQYDVASTKPSDVIGCQLSLWDSLRHQGGYSAHRSDPPGCWQGLLEDSSGMTVGGAFWVCNTHDYDQKMILAGEVDTSVFGPITVHPNMQTPLSFRDARVRPVDSLYLLDWGFQGGNQLTSDRLIEQGRAERYCWYNTSTSAWAGTLIEVEPGVAYSIRERHGNTWDYYYISGGAAPPPPMRPDGDRRAAPRIGRPKREARSVR